MTREHVDELCNALVQNGNIVKARLFSEHDAEQRAEIERLKAELSQRTNLEGPAPCWNSDHMKEIEALKAQLAKLSYDYAEAAIQRRTRALRIAQLEVEQQKE